MLRCGVKNLPLHFFDDSRQLVWRRLLIYDILMFCRSHSMVDNLRCWVSGSDGMLKKGIMNGIDKMKEVCDFRL